VGRFTQGKKGFIFLMRGTPLSPADSLTLDLTGQSFNCRLVPSASNRHVRLRVIPEKQTSSDGCCYFPGLSVVEPPAGSEWLPGLLPETRFCIVVSFPPRVSRHRVLETIRENTEWILAQTQRYTRVQAALLNPLGSGARLMYRGIRLKLLIFPSQKSRATVERVRQSLYCRLPQGKTSTLPKALEKWYRQETLRLVNKVLPGAAAAVTDKPYTVKVRAHRSRWGSCSETGRLSFNWKLSMMPDSVLEYVVIHEVVHLVEFNHSRAFWQKVQEHCPRFKDAKRWLKNNARWLNGWG
jgi:predicted metal-dependent hydrolase